MSVRYPKGKPVAQRWPERTTLERLLDNVAPVTTGCVVFSGALTRHGYGRLNVDGRAKLAHRIAYELMVGEIPAGLTLDHLCKNRACVNTFHLEAVTLAENKRRGDSLPAQYARRDECSGGHEYTPENTRITKQGYRQCRACARERARVRYAEHSALILSQQRAARDRRRVA